MAPPHSTHPFRWAVNAGPQWKPSKTQWERLLDLQDEAEKARIKRFHFEKDAKTALVGRLMLHAAASAALGADPAVVKFARSKENKPYLVPIDGIDCDSFNVNLSHHGEVCTLACGTCCQCSMETCSATLPSTQFCPTQQEASVTTHLKSWPRLHSARIEAFLVSVSLTLSLQWVVLASDSRFLVGCDVMTTCAPRAGESADDFFADFDTSLTENEWRVIRNAGGEGEQLVLFFIHWALKEAYLKATGIGMGIDLDRVEFSISQQAIAEARSRHGRVAPQAATLHIDGKR